MPGYELILVPADNTKPDSNYGELLISGAGVGTGYLNDELQSKRYFSEAGELPRCYRSGDCCSKDEQGLLRFIGRLDSQLKVNGYRIEAEEVAYFLQLHHSIRQAVCLARQHTDSSATSLLAFVVCEPNMPNKDKKRWNQHLAAYLPEWMLPNKYFMLDKMPLGSSGKIDRQALLQLASSTFDSTRINSDSVGLALSRIFCELLELETINPYDSFLMLEAIPC